MCFGHLCSCTLTGTGPNMHNKISPRFIIHPSFLFSFPCNQRSGACGLIWLNTVRLSREMDLKKDALGGSPPAGTHFSHLSVFPCTLLLSMFHPMHDPIATRNIPPTSTTLIVYRENLPGPDIVRIDRLRALSWFYGWWCMAVLSWYVVSSRLALCCWLECSCAAVRTVRTHVAAGGAPKQLATVPYRDLLIFEGSAAFGLRCFHGVTILLITFVSPSLLICFMIVYFRWCVVGTCLCTTQVEWFVWLIPLTNETPAC